jgi:4-diphosphocytidyl-2-C-methyl-D-erythritol kinase
MNGGTLKLLSPAKVNLRLDVLGKRGDGYHEIESIMTRVSLYDEITISVEDGEGLEVTCSDPSLSGEGNIAYKAAKTSLGIYKGQGRLRIYIKKIIPVAAGLGGGSSNAATVLMGLNEALDMGLSREDLMRIGVKLGADVPFFILERAAIARGIGEMLEAIDLPPIWFVLVNPNIHVSTADVYRGLNLKIGLTKEGFGINIPDFNNGVEGVARILHNDLERVALKMHPEIGVVKDEILSSGALGVLMSGSGATVFGLFGSRKGAEDAFDGISSRHPGWRVFVVKNI